jgi:hypothetical protein
MKTYMEMGGAHLQLGSYPPEDTESYKDPLVNI